MESHVHCFGSFRLYLVITHCLRCAIVCVEGCLWPISVNIILIYTDSCAMMYNVANSASVADVMTCLMMCAMLSMAPLLVGIVASLERKKYPPALLRACGSLR